MILMRTGSLLGVALCLSLSVQALTACSVREDRADCPCYTTVLVEDFLRAGFSAATLSFSSDRLVSREDILLFEYEDEAYVASLERRTNRTSLVAGLDRMQVRGDSLLTPYGFESDPIWLYSEKFFCGGDSYIVRARPHKQYCTLKIVEKGLSVGDRSSCSFRVKAEYCGIDLYGRQPLKGGFCADAQRALDGSSSLLLPRQGEGGVILLEVFAGSVLGGEPFVIDVGTKLREAGYDWSLEDLKDVSVTVDYASAEISICIQDWEAENDFNDIKI